MLTKAFAYCQGTMSGIKIKIFRDDGTNYNFIGEVSFNSSAGINEVPMNISVQIDDLIGYYNPGGVHGIYRDSSGGSSVKQSGDITTNTLKSAWTNGSKINKLNAGYDDADHYVKTAGDDAKDGKSWANAWATINKAATTVADGTTVRIGFGDYINEPAANKIAPQNVGASGIFYLPETAETGCGTGTVSVEQNA